MSKGKIFLLKTRNGDGSYSTVAGLRETKSSICAECTRYYITAAGTFFGSEADSKVRASALSGALKDYELSFADGQKLHGKFLIMRLDYTGDYNGERNYTITLESVGEVRIAAIARSLGK